MAVAKRRRRDYAAARAIQTASRGGAARDARARLAARKDAAAARAAAIERKCREDAARKREADEIKVEVLKGKRPDLGDIEDANLAAGSFLRRK